MNSTTVSTSGAAAVQVFPTDASNYVLHNYLFINPATSGAFDFSFDGGTTWHGRPVVSAGPYSEDRTISESIVANKLYIRRNGSTDVAGLIVELYDGILRFQA